MSSYPPHTRLEFPSLSPTMTQGNLAKWYKAEGDEIGAGDVLADIETDKATMAFENQEDGFIAKILVAEGAQNVAVGEVVAIVVEEASHVAAFASYTAEAGTAGAATPTPPSSATPPPPAPDSSAPPPGVAFKMLDMPALSPTMEKGNLVSWSVAAGDEIIAGQVLAEIETDKATLPFENQEDGFIAALLVEAGAKDIPTGTPLAVVVEEREDIAKMAGWTPTTTSTTTTTTTSPGDAPAHDTPADIGDRSRAGRASPAARLLLAGAGIRVEDVWGTGPKGIVTKGDALEAVANPPSKERATQAETTKPSPTKPTPKQTTPPKQAPPPSSASSAPTPSSTEGGLEYVDVPVSQMRRVIASRLLESKTTIPAMYMRMQVDLAAVTEMRATLKAQGSKVSVNDFVVRAAALALMEVPEVNATWDAATNSAQLHDAADISIAVATPGGLITPIVRAANTKSLPEISATVKELATRARDNKLKPEEYTGGSFSISNLGMFGTDAFYAIINPPQCCIMAVGGPQSKVVLQGGKPVGREFMEVSISGDNRAVDELAVAKFLEAFAAYFASPVRLVM